MPKFIGRDVSLFGMSEMDNNGNLGNVNSFLGKWATLEVNVSKDWADLTSSDANEPEKRRTLTSWSATAKTFIDQQGSAALTYALATTDYIYCQFTDQNSGKTITLKGGIDKGGASYGMDKGEDTLEFSSKGQINGAPSITYG